ncbi:hypothetical protein HYDPIDRAFT_137791, partial [Hydnomerulius pinastri MD-312]
MASIRSSFQLFPRHATHGAREIVLNIIKTAKGPMSTKEVYDLAIKRTGTKFAKVEPLQDIKSLLEAKRAAGIKIPRKLPPHPNHEIRSIKYLKTVVLPDLVARNALEKFMTKVTLTPEQVRRRVEAAPSNEQKVLQQTLSKPINAWLWRPNAPAPVTSPAPEPTGPRPRGILALTPAAVGVGGDWSHLNKRRQRARELKVE